MESQKSENPQIFKISDNLDLFTDPNSPLKDAPDYIKQIFTHKSNRSIFINSISHPFGLRRGKSNICTYFFSAGQQYHTCRDCCKNGGGSIMCFCLNCWEPQKHQGHQVEKRTAWSNNAYCDCGWDDRIKPESFCKNHGSKQTVQIEISQQDIRKFEQFFQPLIMIALYLDQNVHQNHPQAQLWSKISKILTILCQSSVYYIRLFMCILQKEIIYDEKKKSILEVMLQSPHDHQYLLFRIAGEKKSKIKLAKTLIKLINLGNWDQSSNYSTLVRDCFTQRSILLDLAQNQIFINKYKDKYFQYADQDPEKGGILLKKYLLFYQKTENEDKFIKFIIDLWKNSFQNIFTNEELAKLLLTYLFNHIKNTQSNSDTQFDDSSIMQRNGLITQFIFVLCGRDIQKLQQFQSKLIQFQISQEQYQQYLFSSMRTSKKLIYRSEAPRDFNIVPLLVLVSQNSSKIELIKVMWQSLTRDNDNLRQDFIETIDVIYHLISLIVNFQDHLKDLKKTQNKQQTEKEKEQWMKCFLYENKKITQQQLMKLRKTDGKLYFKNAGKILRQYCSYRQGTKHFQYISNKTFPNFKLKFKVRTADERGNFRNIPNANITIDSQFTGKSKMTENIFNLLFTNKTFTEYFTKKWWTKFEDNKQDSDKIKFWKNYQLGYHYVFILVCAKLLKTDQNEQLQKQLYKIKSNEQIFNQINSCNNDQNLLKALVSPKKQQKKQIEIKQAEIVNKIKNQEEENKVKINKQSFDRKRHEKFQKFKKRRGQILSEKFSQGMQETNNEDTQQCLICYEGFKVDNHFKDMVYVGKIQTGGNLSTIFHGKDNKSNIMFSTCFHTIHSDCYLQLDKNSLQFSCPLCSQKCNIIFPVKIQDQNSVDKCINVIRAYYLIKFKEIRSQCMLQFIYKHLIQSHGLNSMINPIQYQISKINRKKVNNYMIKLGKYMVNNYSFGNKQTLNSIHNKFIENLNACKSQLAHNVQLLVSKMIFSQIQDDLSIYDQNLLQNIHNQLDCEDFQTLIQSLEYLLGNQQFLDDRLFQKIPQGKQLKRLSFRLIDIPEEIENLDEWKKQPCIGCKQQRDLICLLTGKTLCKKNSCRSLQNHRKQHGNSYIILSITSGKVNTVINNSSNKADDIYFDPFMLPYQHRNKGYPDEKYYLNTYNLEKMLMIFLQAE